MYLVIFTSCLWLQGMKGPLCAVLGTVLFWWFSLFIILYIATGHLESDDIPRCHLLWHGQPPMSLLGQLLPLCSISCHGSTLVSMCLLLSMTCYVQQPSLQRPTVFCFKTTEMVWRHNDYDIEQLMLAGS